MRRKIIKLLLYGMVIFIVFCTISMILLSFIYQGSFSLSPLNVWQKENIFERAEKLKEMGFKGIINDISGELKYKFRNYGIISNKNRKTIFSKTSDRYFMIYKNSSWQEIFIKGVNIGTALPGKWFTEFPRDERVYFDWLEKIGNMNANCIRVYTLLPPEFYRAFLNYNLKHPDNPLWLFQEIWPDENPEKNNYLEPNYVGRYFEEIKLTVDAIHGKANIPERKGRAFGNYNSDVSRYILGYLVGRELEPDEVIETNEKNKGFYYRGEYLYTSEDASPTEGWLAMNCNYLLKYEETTYSTQHPVGIVSWPTLDVIEHDSEWNESGLKSLEYNDKVSIDINHILKGEKIQAGFFGAYHIYPNYPDFMNNEEEYKNYYDDEGRFMYGGYLREFIKRHQKYPALVAEFGLATGMGNAHANPDGYNHGGLTEEDQGRGIVRMMKAIKREGYAGGIIFEWMDEWAKKTWVTEPFMIPYERHVLWHNVIDPEQNYGIYAVESRRDETKKYLQKGNGIIKQIELSSDSSFLYMDINLNRVPEFGSEKIFIGLDTYDRNRGEFCFSPGLEVKSPVGMEFLIELKGMQDSKILVNPGYNISKGKYSSKTSFDGLFEEIRMLINKERITKDGRKIEAVYQDCSKLNYGDFNENSYNHWYIDNNTIHIRIPWGRLNVTDPSSRRVLDDIRQFSTLSRDQLSTVETDGIMVSVVFIDKEKNVLDMLTTDDPFLWEKWEEPSYTERFKKSYFIIKEYFRFY